MTVLEKTIRVSDLQGENFTMVEGDNAVEFNNRFSCDYPYYYIEWDYDGIPLKIYSAENCLMKTIVDEIEGYLF